jgi:hypothetical protein
VDRASRIVPNVPYAQTLAISPGGATLYACISHGPKGQLAAYSAATGQLIRVVHRWRLGQAQNYFCQVSADATGKVLLATYFSNRAPHPSLIGINPQTGTSATLPIQGTMSSTASRPPGNPGQSGLTLTGADTAHTGALASFALLFGNLLARCGSDIPHTSAHGSFLGSRGGPLPRRLLRLGVRHADGTQATTIEQRPAAGPGFR